MLAQCMHFDASTAFGCRQNGQVFAGAGAAAGSSRMNIFEIRQTTNATITNEMTELMNTP